MIGCRAKCLFPIVSMILILSASGIMADEVNEAIKVPSIDGAYVTVYRPAGDRFPGPNTTQLKAGQFYEDWVPNDHAIVKGPDKRWHAIGITHPRTSPEYVHDGEFQSFHAVAPVGSLREVMRDGAWKDRPKILPPSERPGEILSNHAPFIVKHDNQFRMLYGPSPLRWATSIDLNRWTPQGPLADEQSGGRDPNLLEWKGVWYLVYCADDRVDARTSLDLREWSAPRTILTMPKAIAPESPTLVRFNDTFYLFVCGWNGIWDRQSIQGAYQHETYVYQSDDPLDFGRRTAVTQLKSHAPEVFQDEAGDWFISSVEWPQRGMSIAPLVWR